MSTPAPMPDRSRGLFNRMLKHADLGVAVTVVMIVVMMILPLPPLLLDILITVNLSVALIVILISMYTKNALELSVFPSLLLFTTLFRLAINVSVTRLILLHGDAGSVIHAFGEFVVGGNLIVGLVIFLIIVIVQFVVITNGAGRVAEVAARFTLDAMPGKQMAIDADLNSGQITEDEARERRQQVQSEADFYGAMDGASKFVKGDAVAGLVIVAINLIAGIAIGVLQQGRSFSDAIYTFSLLSVGDGLAAQIPALLISTATGVIVTRAASANKDTNDSNLGEDIAGQVFRQHRPLLIAGGVLAGFALIPGLPKLPFFLLAGLLIAVGLLLRRRSREEAAARELHQVLETQRELSAPDDTVQKALSMDLLELDIGYGLITLVDEASGGELLKRVGLVRRQIASELGLVLQPIRVRDSVDLESHAYSISIRGVQVASGSLAAGCMLAMNPNTDTHLIPGEETVEPAFGLPALWVPESSRAAAESSGYTVVDHASVIVTHLTETIRQHAAELLSRQDAKTLLDHLRERVPAVVEDLVPDTLTLAEVHRVLQLLLEEAVSIRDIVTILEVLGDKGRTIKDPPALAEYCRQALARQITSAALDDFGRLAALLLEPTVENEIADSVMQTVEGAQLGLAPDRIEAVSQAMQSAVELAAEMGHRPVFLVAPRVRRHVYALAHHATPGTAVLAYTEVAAGTPVDAVGQVSFGENPAAVETVV